MSSQDQDHVNISEGNSAKRRRIGRACDYGESFFDAYPESPACKALQNVVRGIADQIGVDAKLVLPDD